MIISIVALTFGIVGLVQIVQIKSEIDEKGITHFKIDWLPSFLPLMLIAMGIWAFSTILPIHFYRILILDEIQQAKKCIDERYDYCPHCGEKLEYTQKFPWTDDMIQNSIERSDNENQSKILKWLCDDGRGPLIN